MTLCIGLDRRLELARASIDLTKNAGEILTHARPPSTKSHAELRRCAADSPATTTRSSVEADGAGSASRVGSVSPEQHQSHPPSEQQRRDPRETLATP